MKAIAEKKIVFIIIWAIYIGALLAFSGIDVFTWEFWGLVIAFNLVGLYIYHKITE